MKKIFGLLVLPMLLGVGACDYGPKTSYGFSLPDGDVAAGEQNFRHFQCNDCHVVADKPALREGTDPLMDIALGGKTTRIKTYGELVTSIINPSHKLSRKYGPAPVAEDGESLMRNYNQVMTVSELIDLVAFVQQQYELEPYSATLYPAFPTRMP